MLSYKRHFIAMDYSSRTNKNLKVWNSAMEVTTHEESTIQIIHMGYPVYCYNELKKELILLSSAILIKQNNINKLLKTHLAIDDTIKQSKKECVHKPETINSKFLAIIVGHLQQQKKVYFLKVKDIYMCLTFLKGDGLLYILLVLKEEASIFDYQNNGEFPTLIDLEMSVINKITVLRQLAFLLLVNALLGFSHLIELSSS